MDDIINLDIRQHLVNLDTCPMKLLTVQEVFLYCTLQDCAGRRGQREASSVEACWGRDLVFAFPQGLLPMVSCAQANPQKIPLAACACAQPRQPCCADSPYKTMLFV